MVGYRWREVREKLKGVGRSSGRREPRQRIEKTHERAGRMLPASIEGRLGSLRGGEDGGGGAFRAMVACSSKLG